MKFLQKKRKTFRDFFRKKDSWGNTSTGLDSTAPATFRSISSVRASPDGYDPLKFGDKKYYDKEEFLGGIERSFRDTEKSVHIISKSFYDKNSKEDNPFSGPSDSRSMYSFSNRGLDCFESYCGTVSRLNPLVHHPCSEFGDSDDACSVAAARSINSTVDKKETEFGTIHVYATNPLDKPSFKTSKRFSREDLWFSRGEPNEGFHDHNHFGNSSREPDASSS